LKIEFYSGSKGKERPVAFPLDGKRTLITCILREERIGDVSTEIGYKRVFWVETEDGSIWILRQISPNCDDWEAERFLQ
jgi:hypothetical protein